MPAKRTQTSKQRRAAQNKAAREALAARRQAASRASASAEAKAGSTSAPAKRRGLFDLLAFGRQGRSGAGDRSSTSAPRAVRPPSRLSRVPPERLALFGLGLAVVASAAVLLLPFVEVEGTRRGDEAEYESLLAATGAGAIAYVAIPVALAALGFWAARPPRRPRILMGAALGLVACVFVSAAGPFYLFSAASLGLAAWHVRRAMVAERQAPAEAVATE